MKFTKMHGCGNDYVYVNAFEETVADPSAVSIRVSDRHFGIGSDGLILIAPSEVADFQMIMYNADGSRSQMCGNGIRCVAKYVYDHGMTDQDVITVETLAGIKTLYLTIKEGKVEKVRVDMGEPILTPSEVPVIMPENFAGPAVKAPFDVNGTIYELTCVSVGNPHAVTFLDDVASLKIEDIGPAIENHPRFPERVNAEFVRIIDRQNVEMRVWERGSGETLACGTGSCATAVACVLNGLTDRGVNVRLLGGTLEILWDETDNHIYMTGPAEEVFSGWIA